MKRLRMTLEQAKERRDKWIKRSIGLDKRMAILQKTKDYADQRIRELSAQIVEARDPIA